MKGNHTLSLWNLSVTPYKVVIPGQVLKIAGTEVGFIGIGLDHSAYFWLAPGEARFMMNDELWRFDMAVVSCMEGVKNYVRKRNGEPA